MDVTEGSEIQIEYYELKGFQPLLAGFFNSRNNKWYWFNRPNYFIFSWINLRSDYNAIKWLTIGVTSFILMSYVAVSASRSYSKDLLPMFFIMGMMVVIFYSIKRIYRWIEIRASGLKNRSVHPDFYDSSINYINNAIADGVVKKYSI